MLSKYGLNVLDHHRDKTVVKRRWQVYMQKKGDTGNNKDTEEVLKQIAQKTSLSLI